MMDLVEDAGYISVAGLILEKRRRTVGSSGVSRGYFEVTERMITELNPF